MKKTVISLISVLLMGVMIFTLSSCGTKTASDVPVKDIYQKITEAVALPDEIIELTADDLMDYYGIEADKVAECAAVQDACGYKDEIVIIKAADETAAADIGNLFTQHIDYQKDSMKNYDADQYEVLGSSKVIVNGSYAAMFISGSQDKMAEIFNSFFD